MVNLYERKGKKRKQKFRGEKVLASIESVLLYIYVCVKITPHIFMGSHVAGFSFSRFSLTPSDS